MNILTRKKNYSSSVLFASVLVLAFAFASCKEKSSEAVVNEAASSAKSEEEIKIDEEKAAAEAEAAKAKEMGLLGEKLKPNKVGDIVFLDGSAIAWRKDLELDVLQRLNVVAVIFYVGNECSDDESQRILGVGLKHSKEEIVPELVSDANTAILDSVMGRDGSNQLEKISNYMINHIGMDDTASREYYAPFYFAKEYPKLLGGRFDGSIYEQGWYLPSVTELKKLNEWYDDYTNETYKAYLLCNGDSFVGSEKSVFWSSSYWFRGYGDTPMASYQYARDFSDQMTLSTERRAYVCAIRDFTNDKNSALQKRVEEAPFFPEYDETFYIGEHNDWTWNDPYQTWYNAALPDYLHLNPYSDENNGHEALAIIDCQVLHKSDSDEVKSEMVEIPAGTKLLLKEIGGYGISQCILYPVYKAEYNDEESGESISCLVRGIDITDMDDVVSVSDGKGGTLTLFYQRALNTRYKDGDYGPSMESINEYLNNWATYEEAGLHGGYHMNYAGIIDSKNNFYKLDIETDGVLKIEYPLNMDNPVPFVIETRYNGGMGGGFSSTKISSLEVSGDKAKLNFWCDFEVLDTDGGPTGTKYWFFTKDSLWAYVLQADENKVICNESDVYTQDPDNPYVYSKHSVVEGEPGGNDVIKKTGQFLNPVCPLKMREKPDTTSEKLYTLAPGTLVKVLEEGKSVWIDGHYCNWVRVQMVNDGAFLEGYRSENKTTGWVFGGYLE